MFEGLVCREHGCRDFLGACQASGSTLLNVSQRPCLAVTRVSSDNGGRASGSPGGELSACPRVSGWPGALQNGAAHLLAVTAPLAFHGVPSARRVRADRAAESAVWGHMGSTESGPDARAFSENHPAITHDPCVRCAQGRARGAVAQAPPRRYCGSRGRGSGVETALHRFTEIRGPETPKAKR